jgi:membrane-associated protein
MFNVINLIIEYSYLGIFLIVFFESGIFFALPGDSLLFAVGLLSAKGILNIYPAVIIIIIASILGGNAGYFIGKYFDKITESKYFNKYLSRILHRGKIEEARVYFYKHGHKTILFARFIPIVRTFAPMVAGFSEMPFKKFLKYNILGSVLWGTSIPFAGYFLGESFPFLEKNISMIAILIIIVSLLPIMPKLIRRLYKK